MNCKNCNEPLEDSWDECPYCETPVIKKLLCTSCGRELNPKMVKCPYCKTPTGKGTSTPTATPDSNKNYSSGAQNYSLVGGFEQTQYAGPQQIQQIDLTIGDTIASNYTIKKKIGQGGFGGVYEMYHNILEEAQAVKVIHFINKETIKNILLEYKSRNRIKNFDNVIVAHQPIEAQYRGQDLILYPMELAERSMREWLNETKQDLEERLEEGLKIFKQACRGVEAIHEAGLIHLDLKPENILLTENKKAKDLEDKWQVKISDFGLARGSGNTNLEMLQDGIGTPAYMAPEQILAARSKDVGKEADIYALGMILYELIDGDLPYEGRTPEEIKAKKRDKTIDITPLKSDAAVAKVAMECLERDKTKRIKSVGNILIRIDEKRREEEEKRKKKEKAKELFEEGKRLAERERYEEALKLFGEVEELDKDNVEIKEWKQKTEESIKKQKEEEAKRKVEEERKRKEAEEKRRREEEKKQEEIEAKRKQKEKEENKRREEAEKLLRRERREQAQSIIDLGHTINNKYVPYKFEKNIYFINAFARGDLYDVCCSKCGHSYKYILENDFNCKEKEIRLKLSQLRCLYIESFMDSQILFKTQTHDLKEIYFAKDFDEALSVLNSNDVDLIIVCIELQGVLNGLDVFRELRKNSKYKNIPIIAITVYVLPGDEIEFIKTGFDGFISKPFDYNKLINVIENLLTKGFFINDSDKKNINENRYDEAIYDIYSKKKVKTNGTLYGNFILHQKVSVTCDCPYCQKNNFIDGKFGDSVTILCSNCKRGIKLEIRTDNTYLVS